jgi:hypothetical protein
MPTTYASAHQYPVTDSELVYLSVTIGQGALGSTLVLLAGNHLCAGTGIQSFPIGKGADIRGKLMLITSAMSATQVLTSDEVDLAGGASPQSWTDQHAGNPGDNVIYACTVLFV